MEVFYEDILETFLFCFFASLGIIQIMAGRRGWHGLSIYGGRVRRNVNYAIGTALVIFAYAWYFSDPLHRKEVNLSQPEWVALVTWIDANAPYYDTFYNRRPADGGPPRRDVYVDLSDPFACQSR